MLERITKKIKIGNLCIGGGESVKIQSMCTTKTSDIEATVKQITGLYNVGCEIVRVSILDEADARAIKDIKSAVHVPIVADIHFSYKLAMLAIESGCDKVRINPGNIGEEKEINLVADCIKSHGISVRVGANTGSIKKEYLQKYGRSAKALVESALDNARILEKRGVEDIVLSVKASDVPLTYEAYGMLAGQCDYPLHIGVTEAGTEAMALAKSYSALGALLLNGIGDTLRISITGDPIREVYAAKRLLRAVGLDEEYVDVVSCPTCGRCAWDSISLANEVEQRVSGVKKRLKIAVMGCVVNGPGEARDCDIGIAGASEYCVIFKKGEPIKRVPSNEAKKEFFKVLDELLNG